MSPSAMSLGVAELRTAPSAPAPREFARRIGRAAVGSLRDLVAPPAGQIPALDALRTCAVLGVIACHVAEAAAHAGSPHDLFCRLPVVRMGWLGVDLFFVLSGYLIGRQLWREYRGTGTVKLAQFALRRGLRIWPLYFATLIFVLAVFGGWERGWVDAAFLSNYVSGGRVPGGWSLATEEHFYILAPLLLVVGGACRLPTERFRPILLACLIGLPVVRFLTASGVLAGLSTFADPFDRIYRPIHAHADGLLVGLLLASARGLDRRRGASAWALAVAAAFFVASWVIRRDVLLFSGAAVFFGAVVWFLLARPAFSRAVLGWRPAFTLSRLSFGMYLNHALLLPVVFGTSARVAPEGATATVGFVLVVAASAGCAALTYVLIESPFLTLRSHLLERRHAEQAA